MEESSWMKTYLRNAVLATIIYYDIFDLPLNVFDIYRYLINPARLSRIRDGIGDINFDDIHKAAESLKSAGLVGDAGGYYFLKDRKSLIDLKREKDLIFIKKAKDCLRWAPWLALAPFLKAVFASGSLAMNNSDKTSDYDVFIIAKSGRLYTCRFFLWLVSSLLGKRRKPGQLMAPDKFCFNHYITDSNLNIDHESIYTAQAYSHLKPILNLSSQDFLANFLHSNIWIKNYVYNFRYRNENILQVNPGWTVNAIRKFLEYILSGFIGNWLELKLKRYQSKRIAENPVTKNPRGRIVFNDRELEFHPHSFEKVVISRYNAQLKKMGVFPFIEEKDSGLVN